MLVEGPIRNKNVFSLDLKTDSESLPITDAGMSSRQTAQRIEKNVSQSRCERTAGWADERSVPALTRRLTCWLSRWGTVVQTCWELLVNKHIFGIHLQTQRSVWHWHKHPAYPATHGRRQRGNPQRETDDSRKVRFAHVRETSIELREWSLMLRESSEVNVITLS